MSQQNVQLISYIETRKGFDKEYTSKSRLELQINSILAK